MMRTRTARGWNRLFPGIALMRCGCERSLPYSAFNVFGPLFVAVVGISSEWAIGDGDR